MKKKLMQKTVKSILAFLMIGVFSSCVNLKKVELIQEKTIKDLSNEVLNADRDAYKINSGDHLYIKIFSSDAQTSKYFQSDFPELMNSSYIYLNSYKVDNEGYVNYSFTGKTKVKGLTIEEAQQAISKNLNEYFKDIQVYVKLVSFDISILGEVNKPGTYTIDRDQINILQALGKAGGLTAFGRADKVILVRKSENGSKVKYIDLTDDGLLSSEYYFLLPDDVIYIAPRSSKTFAFEKLPYGLLFGILSLAISVMALTK